MTRPPSPTAAPVYLTGAQLVQALQDAEQQTAELLITVPGAVDAIARMDGPSVGVCACEHYEGAHNITTQRKACSTYGCPCDTYAEHARDYRLRATVRFASAG